MRTTPTCARLLLALVLLLAVAACGEREEPPSEPSLTLAPARFADLAGWAEDEILPALRAFRRSCEALLKRPAAEPMGPGGIAGTVGDWHPACAAARAVPEDEAAARRFVEESFQPWQVSDRGKTEGLFTGYYEPLLDGVRQPDPRFRHPLYKRPGDLISVDLGQFDESLAGRRIAGKVQGGRLVPYASRAEIERGALAGRGLELFWVADPVAHFFLQIQGSGQIELPDGSRARVGFADQNGHPYRAIGKDLIEMGALTKEEVSLQTIRAWLQANPERAPEVMARNRAYVFFRELDGRAEGPVGAQGVTLTPERSLAVDRKFLPLGAPVWLDTTAPWPEGDRPLRRLLVAQDTGGAIRGVVRGDVFWGAGPMAEHLAGHMKSRGRYHLLLPRHLSPAS